MHSPAKQIYISNLVPTWFRPGSGLAMLVPLSKMLVPTWFQPVDAVSALQTA